jgi:hypothetical protein
MSTFLQQLPALIGVVVGALGSYVAVALSDRARFRREQAARWQDRRLSVYSDYARAVKATITVTFRLAAHFGNDPHPYPTSRCLPGTLASGPGTRAGRPPGRPGRRRRPG